MKLQSGDLPLGKNDFAFELTPVGPTPYVSTTNECTQNYGPVGGTPEMGTPDDATLPVDWSKTISKIVSPNAPNAYCHYGMPMEVDWQAPTEFDGSTTYALTITPKSGGAPHVFQGSALFVSLPPFNSCTADVSDLCTDPEGYDLTVQAFKDGSPSEPGALATTTYGPTANAPTLLAPGIAVGSGTPPTVDPNEPVTFTWSSPFAPMGYEISINHGSAYKVKNQPVMGPPFTVSLPSKTTWTWTVAAVTPTGVVAAPEFTFTTGGLVAPTLFSPTVADKVDPAKPVTFQWSAEATRGGVYWLSVSVHGTGFPLVTNRPVGGTVLGNTVTDTESIPELISGGQYDWTVASLGWGGDVAVSAPGGFLTTTPPAPPPGCNRVVVADPSSCTAVSVPNPKMPFTIAYSISGASFPYGNGSQYMVQVQDGSGPEIGSFDIEVGNEYGTEQDWCDAYQGDCQPLSPLPGGWFEPQNECNPDDVCYPSPMQATQPTITLTPCVPAYPGSAGTWQLQIICE